MGRNSKPLGHFPEVCVLDYVARVFPGRRNGFDVAVDISRGRCKSFLTSQFLVLCLVAGAQEHHVHNFLHSL